MVIQVFSDYACPYSYLAWQVFDRVEAEVVWRAAARIDGRWRDDILQLAGRLGVAIEQPVAAPDTRRAHEAAAWARARGAFDGFHRRLFEAHFREGLDIGDAEVLGDIAWKTGLNRSELKDVLEQGLMVDEVEEDLLIGRTYGIKGLPTMVVGGRMIFGVQDVETIKRAIRDAGRGDFPPGPGAMGGLTVIEGK